jgi:hypothetical protein
LHANRAIPALLVAHLVAGLLASRLGVLPLAVSWGPPPAHLVVAVFHALICAQAGLLGVWAALSEVATWKRLAGFIIGVAYLDWLGNGHFGDFAPDFTIAIAVFTILILVRQCRIQIHRFPLRSGPTKNGDLRFSIRSLMLFTGFIALCTMATMIMRTSVIMLFAVDTLFSVIVMLTSVWAALSWGRPMPRSMAVLTLAAALGLLFALGIDGEVAQRVFQSRWMGYFLFISVALLEAVFLLSSLLIVRSCGYRLAGTSVSERIETDQSAISRNRAIGESPVVDVETILRTMRSDGR